MSDPRVHSAAARDPRPGIAFIANAMAPYRLHFLEKLAAELRGFNLHCLVTHASSGYFPWAMELPAGLKIVNFAAEHEVASGTGLRTARRDWAKGGRIVEYLREHDIRAVICHGYNTLTMLRVIYYCHRHGIKCFVRGDSNVMLDHPRGLKKLVKRGFLGWVLKRVDGVMPVGTMGQRYFEKYGARPERVFRVTFEVDYESFGRVDRAALDQFMAQHRMEPARKRVLFSGRLIPLKRLDLLIDAFASLANQRPEWDLVIAGDGPLRAELERRVPEGLRGRAIWLGFCDLEPMRLAYQACHVMAFTSEYDAWGLVVQEAMGAGLVVVSSDVCGVSCDLVAEGVSGRLFRSGDLADLKEKLLEVTDPTNLARYEAGVGPTLAKWRRESDAVEGVRRALAAVGLPADPTRGSGSGHG